MQVAWFLLSILCAEAAHAAALDPAYPRLVHPMVDDVIPGRAALAAEPRSDVFALVARQTPVKSQEERGTCSIFSATGLLESMLRVAGIARGPADLSEQWLQYLIARDANAEGSTSDANFEALRRHGSPSEERMPYEGVDWLKGRPDGFLERCGHLSGAERQGCRVAHRDLSLLDLSDDELRDPASGPRHDPAFADARAEARANRERFFGRLQSAGTVLTATSAIKASLRAGVPLALDLDFYYGAWNDRDGSDLGISYSRKLWEQGVVTFPEPGSMDRAHSHRRPAGHSVVLVGYDDEVEVTFTAKMLDGSRRTFHRRGVYYFKNSWGTTDWGRDFAIDGRALPGYGMITQDYAHEHGQFFRLRLRGGP